MSINQYQPCPCGSGKKFKWCCQPLTPYVEKTFSLQEKGQHQAAFKAADDMTKAHEANPQAWAYKAQLYLNAEQPDEAEKALERALEINPAHPFALLLRGGVLYEQGEHLGALTLYRRAAEAYAPEAAGPLVSLYEQIARLELMNNRPVATRHALDCAIGLNPNDEELRQIYTHYFESELPLPAAARKNYELRTPAAGAARSAWAEVQNCLKVPTRPMALRDACKKLTEAAADDPAAWFDLAAAEARLGDHLVALEALQKCIELEADGDAAAEAVALAEVLRCGQGVEQQSDHRSHQVTFPLNDYTPVMELIRRWGDAGDLIVADAERERAYINMIVLESGSELVVAGGGTDDKKISAFLILSGPTLSVTHPRQVNVDRVAEKLEEELGQTLEAPTRRLTPIRFSDVCVEALALAVTTGSDDVQARAKARDGARHFFETVWVGRNLKSLNGLTPRQAADAPDTRKLLPGLIRFQEDCFHVTEVDPESNERKPSVYDFDGLRRVLNCLPGEDKPAAPAADAASADPATLTGEQLLDAFRTALREKNAEATERLAVALTGRPAADGPADRFGAYSHLIQKAGDASRIDELLDAGSAFDSEHNGGSRAADFAQLRGRTLARRGDGAGAKAAFEAMAEADPDNLERLGGAVETLLGVDKSAAGELAERGLAEARRRQSRDLEGYFLDLTKAAGKGS